MRAKPALPETRSSFASCWGASGASGLVTVVVMCPPRDVTGEPKGLADTRVVRVGGPWCPGRVQGTPRAGLAPLPGAVLRVLQDVLCVFLGDDRRTGVHRLSTADVVAVDQLQVDARDTEVALDEGLLVDGEENLAVDDVLRHVGVQ